LGVKIVPEVTPLALKPAPETFTPEMLTSEFPVLVRLVLSELLREGEGLPGHREARSADRRLGDGQAARTRVAKDDGLLATDSNSNTPEIHTARASA
jgi:hypothetical protein